MSGGLLHLGHEYRSALEYEAQELVGSRSRESSSW